MKLKKNIVIFDLEATSNQVDEQRPEKQKNNFIIEIGAVLVTPDLEIISKFEHLVRPEEEITPFITQLTGITNKMVKNQPLWPDVNKLFSEWIKDNGNPKKTRLAAWNNYFVMPMLTKVCDYYNTPYPFYGYMIDIKSIAFMWASLKGLSSNELTVEEAAKRMGIDVSGDFHRALCDAETEAKIFIKAMTEFRDGCYIPDKDGKAYNYLKVQVE